MPVSTPGTWHSGIMISLPSLQHGEQGLHSPSMPSAYAPGLHLPHTALEVNVQAFVVSRYSPQFPQSSQAPALREAEYVSPSTHGLHCTGVEGGITSPQLTERPSVGGHFKQFWHWIEPVFGSLIVIWSGWHEELAWTLTSASYKKYLSVF